MIPVRLRPEPLLRVRPRSKNPVDDSRAVESLNSIEQWVAGGGNAAIALAETDVVVVDVDTRPVAWAVMEVLPDTFTVETGSGWYHCYYRCADWTQNTTLDGDSSVRSDGWIAIVPPSKHPNGGRYSVHRDCPIAEIDESELRRLVDRFNDDSDGEHPDPNPDPESDPNGEHVDGEHVDGDRDDLGGLDELIQHDGYRAEVREVLHDHHAGHDRRVWLAGFLCDAVGLSESEVVRVIDRHNRWSNYDRSTTRRQVASVVRSGGGR
jgi:hypothetical protein